MTEIKEENSAIHKLISQHVPDDRKAAFELAAKQLDGDEFAFLSSQFFIQEDYRKSIDDLLKTPHAKKQGLDRKQILKIVRSAITNISQASLQESVDLPA
ncbi:MAG: hypothetical protein AAF901_07555, partial [Bacteroidota bacterium]